MALCGRHGQGKKKLMKRSRKKKQRVEPHIGRPIIVVKNVLRVPIDWSHEIKTFTEDGPSSGGGEHGLVMINCQPSRNYIFRYTDQIVVMGKLKSGGKRRAPGTHGRKGEGEIYFGVRLGSGFHDRREVLARGNSIFKRENPVTSQERFDQVMGVLLEEENIRRGTKS